MFGSSIRRRAFLLARSKQAGSSLGLDVELWWQGYGGMTIKKSRRRIETLLQVEHLPNYLFLHIGGNDLGNTDLKSIKQNLDCLFLWLLQTMPGVIIVWSEILPRD